MDKYDILIAFAIFLGGGILFIAGAYASADLNIEGFIKYKLNKQEPPNSIQEIINNCDNKDLSDSIDCIKKYTYSMYKYNLTDDKITLTFDQLKVRGGDCLDWTRLYEQIAKSLGFNTTQTTVFVKDNSTINFYHTNLMVYNEEGYCLLDLNKDYP